MNAEDFIRSLFGDDDDSSSIDRYKVNDLLDFLENKIDYIIGIDTTSTDNIERVSFVISKSSPSRGDLPGFGGDGNEPDKPTGPEVPTTPHRGKIIKKTPKPSFVFELD